MASLVNIQIQMYIEKIVYKESHGKCYFTAKENVNFFNFIFISDSVLSIFCDGLFHFNASLGKINELVYKTIRGYSMNIVKRGHQYLTLKNCGLWEVS